MVENQYWKFYRDVGWKLIDNLGPGVCNEEQMDSAERHLIIDHNNSTDPESKSFLFYVMMSFLKADRENFEILRPAIRVLIEKYKITCTCEKKVTPNW